MRLKGRSIARTEIIESTSAYEIIESYPEDKYFPSYLVYTRSRGVPLHVLFGVDVREDNVRIVTAYRPSPDEWETDSKTRRGRP